MNLIVGLKDLIIKEVKTLYNVADEQLANLEFRVNAEHESQFGDISCNVAMILAKSVGRAPRDIAAELQNTMMASKAAELIASITIAGPGFLNLTLTPKAWQTLVGEVYQQKKLFFIPDQSVKRHNYLIEFVSANPTGPLHLGHGRGGIIGDTLARVLAFLGHTVSKEFYINDAGNQIKLLGQSLKARCLQELGQAAVLPEEGYAGEYVVDLAKDCVQEQGEPVKDKSDQFFELYAKEQLLCRIKATLGSYGITFDTWFSEKTLHDSGAIDKVIATLQSKDLAYEQDGALWFRSTHFGDDKDRVIRKANGELTYIAADIAYHKDKFDRGYDTLINILGHDHHGYVKRLQGTMQALGFGADRLQVILYNLVKIKKGDEFVRMSKRAGNFTELAEVIDTVGVDVARFFYLNRKTEAPLEFDIDTALKKTDENPVYYIQYAYVRLNSIFAKARQEDFGQWVDQLFGGQVTVEAMMPHMGNEELALIKKVVALQDTLAAIAASYQTHLLSYYALELAQKLHTYYTRNKVIDANQAEISRVRLFAVFMVHQTLDVTLELLGLQKPEKM